jgi:alkylated DNA repair dioxygenase AlkB
MHSGHSFCLKILMEQLSIFDEVNLDATPLKGLLDYRPAMFGIAESNLLLKKLIAGTPWTQRSVLMYGKEVITPRLTAWFGDENADYSVSGNGYKPLPWTEELLQARDRVTGASGIVFNSVLLNYYRDGSDSVSWHDDMDGIPGRNSLVASVSLGEVRVFDVRSKADHTVKFSIPLQNGSYLLMKGDFQLNWQHRIAKSNKPLRERVNLTFRSPLTP